MSKMNLNMRKNIYVLLLLSLIMVLGSCYSDKGNYDYEDVNEITVDLGGAKYTYVVGNVANWNRLLLLLHAKLQNQN